jgi:sulfate transport system substrate-binding protein
MHNVLVSVALLEPQGPTLYSPEGQEIIARHGFRPRDEKVLQKSAGRFPAIKTFDVEQTLGSWKDVQKKHFAEGGIYDQIAVSKR